MLDQHLFPQSALSFTSKTLICKQFDDIYPCQRNLSDIVKCYFLNMQNI